MPKTVTFMSIPFEPKAYRRRKEVLFFAHTVSVGIGIYTLLMTCGSLYFYFFSICRKKKP